MNELDRRIAVEIMGEPEPKPYHTRRPHNPPAIDKFVSVGGGWRWSWGVGWKPLPFSTNLEYAMKAAEYYIRQWKARYPSWREYPHQAVLYMDRSFTEYEGREPRLAYRVAFGEEYAFGTTLPEAICNLLLALKEKP